ncbi:MAG: energy transducer TonB [Saprospiraceae bacterium]
MENFSLGFAPLALAILGLTMLVISIVFALRHYLVEKSRSVPVQPNLNARNKYPEVDVFRHSDIFFKVGLAVALGLVTLAFSWTHYEKHEYVPIELATLDEIEIEIPRTLNTPPPSIPPPPPAVVEIVPDEMKLNEDQVEFVDIYLNENEQITTPASVKKDVTPPPPPPKIEEPDEPFIIVEEMPRFPGCENLSTKQEKNDCTNKKLLEFIYKNIKYPPVAAENGIQGTVPIKFVVEKDGTIANAQVLRDIGGGCGQEAIRVVELMNKESIKWKPGMQGGRPVRVQFNLPVKFKLQ